jgi:hypothetical protein
MPSDNDNDGNDQSSYDNSSGDDDEMIHTTASKKEVRNIIFFKFISSSNVSNIYSQTIKQESLCEMIQYS